MQSICACGPGASPRIAHRTCRRLRRRGTQGPAGPQLASAAPRPEAGRHFCRGALGHELGGTLLQAPLPFPRPRRPCEVLFRDFLKLPTAGRPARKPSLCPSPGPVGTAQDTESWGSRVTGRGRSLPVRAQRGLRGVSPVPARAPACTGAWFTFPLLISLTQGLSPGWVGLCVPRRRLTVSSGFRSCLEDVCRNESQEPLCTLSAYVCVVRSEGNSGKSRGVS